MNLITLGTGAGNSLRERANAANLIFCGGKYYLVDAGEPVKAMIMSRSIPYTDIQEIFISHHHQDHIGGLPGFMNCFFRPPVTEKILNVYLPEPEAQKSILSFIRGGHRDIPEGKLFFHPVKQGLVFDDGNLKVTAFPTRHIEPYPSYAFLLEHADSRLVITGDLHYEDFADFPKAAFDKPAVCLCEAVHGSSEGILDAVREQTVELPIQKMIFTHYKGVYLTTKKELYQEKTSDLPFSCVLAKDDDEFEI